MRHLNDTTRARAAVVLAAATGFVLCAIAAVCSYWALVGATPAWLYGRTAQFATMRRLGGLPIEFSGAVWFAAVTLLYVLGWTRRNRVPAIVFLSAVPMASLAIWQAASRSFHLAPLTAVAVAAAIVLVASAIETSPLGEVVPQLLPDLRSALQRPPIVAVAIAFASLTTLAAQFVILKAHNVSVRLATQQEFRTWWSAQKRSTHPELVRVDAIRVVVFTDYQCPACSSAVPQREALINRYRRELDCPIELVTRDFPLDSECNPGVERAMHPMACEMAAAVRLVSHRLGPAAAQELGHWLYKNRERMTVDVLRQRLDEHGLGDTYAAEYEALVQDVASDAALGFDLGVHYTPAFFVNGVQLPDTSARSFELALEYEIERQSPRTRRFVID